MASWRQGGTKLTFDSHDCQVYPSLEWFGEREIAERMTSLWAYTRPVEQPAIYST